MLPERLKEVRKRHGLTQRALAAKINISQSTIAQYETGDRNPDPDTLKKIADFFGVTTDYLLGRTSIAEAKNDKFSPELLEYLEKTKDLRIGGHTLNDSQRKIVIDFFKEVIAKNFNSEN